MDLVTSAHRDRLGFDYEPQAGFRSPDTPSGNGFDVAIADVAEDAVYDCEDVRRANRTPLVKSSFIIG